MNPADFAPVAQYGIAGVMSVVLYKVVALFAPKREQADNVELLRKIHEETRKTNAILVRFERMLDAVTVKQLAGGD